MRRVFLLHFVVIVGALTLSSAATAQITVGQVSPAASPATPCAFNRPFDEFQYSVADGTSYVVPTAGVLTSWSTKAGAGAGQVLGLKVFRWVGGGVYQVVGHDGPRALAPGALNTFPAAIPVLRGDVLGFEIPIGDPELGAAPTACFFETGEAGDRILAREGAAADGALVTPGESHGEARMNLSATLLLPPALAAISPAKGSVKGGAKVVLRGAEFANVLGVSFGSVAAKSFTVDSESQITAVVPASRKLAKVPVTVTTAAGTATAATPFAYKGCRVPGLRGKTLKAAKQALRKKECKLGRVRTPGDATAKTGKVTGQKPKPGKLLAPNSKVHVTLG